MNGNTSARIINNAHHAKGSLKTCFARFQAAFLLASIKLAFSGCINALGWQAAECGIIGLLFTKESNHVALYC